jgi:hypothetical protein
MYNLKWYACLCISVVFLTSFKIANEKDDWKLGADKDGIKIYTKKSEEGKIRTSKAEMFLSVPASKVVEILSDYNNFSKWFPSCLDSKILKKVSENESISHVIYKTPWPLPNVDCIQRMVIDKSIADTVSIRVSAVPDYMAPSGSCARVKEMKGSWKIVSVKGGVMVTNIYYSDMANLIPYWLANTQAVDIPFNIFHNMREFVISGKGKK